MPMRRAVSIAIVALALALPVRAQMTFEQALRDLTSTDAGMRRRAAQMLKEAAYPEAAVPLAALVTDPDDDVQLQAIAGEINIFRAENDAPDLPKQNRPLTAKLSRASDGPTLTLPAPVLDEFMAQWEESNQRVARELLGDESGQLFRTPRKTRNTTTQQCLDPARLEHFITLVELPEQLHSPLRRLVERETKAG